jgi:hypothetical protein
LRRPALLDTNLLVLLVVGLTSREYISIHKKLTSFSEQDFEILETLLSEASEISNCSPWGNDATLGRDHLVDK